jgi:hypothetical protein
MDAGSEVVVRGVSESSIGLVTATRQELVAGSQDTICDWYRAKRELDTDQCIYAKQLF